MTTALTSALTQAHQAQYQSLAIPSLGTGNLRWPHDVVARTTFDAVINFSKANPGTSLKNIVLVIYPADQPSLLVNHM